MIFKVERTSMWNNDVPPIKEAYKGKCMETQLFLSPSFEAYEEKFEESFTSVGVNHRQFTDKTIARDFETDCYLIDINTLEDLMKLENKYGEYEK